MSNLGWTCPTCKTNWSPSVLKCDCGPKSLATTAMEQKVIRQFGPGGTA